MFKKEIIPDNDKLFYRAHEMYFRDGELTIGVFRERGEGDNRGMSTDWEKYGTPQKSREAAKNPKKNAIISFKTGDLRKEDLSVEHAPTKESKNYDSRVIPANQAHTNVKGKKKPIHEDEKARLNLFSMFSWEIRLE